VQPVVCSVLLSNGSLWVVTSIETAHNPTTLQQLATEDRVFLEPVVRNSVKTQCRTPTGGPKGGLFMRIGSFPSLLSHLSSSLLPRLWTELQHQEITKSPHAVQRSTRGANIRHWLGTAYLYFDGTVAASDNSQTTG